MKMSQMVFIGQQLSPRGEKTMAEAKFTPGPWKVFKGGNFTQIWCQHYSGEVQPSAYLIGEANYRQSDEGENTPEQSHANASLMAASPDAHALISRAVADRIDDEWLKAAKEYLAKVAV
jgi:hypothetical protein